MCAKEPTRPGGFAHLKGPPSTPGPDRTYGTNLACGSLMQIPCRWMIVSFFLGAAGPLTLALLLAPKA